MAETVAESGAAGEPAGDPVAEPPVVGVAPDVGVGGEGRVGPRVPGVDVHVVEVEHAAGVDGRGGIGAGDVVGIGRVEAGEERLQVAALDEVVARTLRVIGQRGLRAFRVDEDVGLVGALVDRGTAELGEPDGFALRHPGRGRGGFHAGRPIEVLVEPPALDVLELQLRGGAGVHGTVSGEMVSGQW